MILTKRIVKTVEEYLWSRELTYYEHKLLKSFLRRQFRVGQLSNKQWNLVKLWLKRPERKDVKEDFKV